MIIHNVEKVKAWLNELRTYQIFQNLVDDCKDINEIYSKINLKLANTLTKLKEYGVKINDLGILRIDKVKAAEQALKDAGLLLKDGNYNPEYYDEKTIEKRRKQLEKKKKSK